MLTSTSQRQSEEHNAECRRRGPDQLAFRQLVRNISSARDFQTSGRHRAGIVFIVFINRADEVKFFQATMSRGTSLIDLTHWQLSGR